MFRSFVPGLKRRRRHHRRRKHQHGQNWNYPGYKG